MTTFNFKESVKVTIWEDRDFQVEAESKEDAIEKLKLFYANENRISSSNDAKLSKFNIIDSDDVNLDMDYIESVDLSDNNGNATILIFDEDGEVILENNDLD